MKLTNLIEEKGTFFRSPFSFRYDKNNISFPFDSQVSVFLTSETGHSARKTSRVFRLGRRIGSLRRAM